MHLDFFYTPYFSPTHFRPPYLFPHRLSFLFTMLKCMIIGNYGFPIHSCPWSDVVNNTKYGNIYCVASKRGSVCKHENINELHMNELRGVVPSFATEIFKMNTLPSWQYVSISHSRKHLTKLLLYHIKKKSEMRSFKSNENIHKKEGVSYYVVSANKASSVTLQSHGNESQRKHCNFCDFQIGSRFKDWYKSKWGPNK